MPEGFQRKRYRQRPCRRGAPPPVNTTSVFSIVLTTRVAAGETDAETRRVQKGRTMPSAPAAAIRAKIPSLLGRSRFCASRARLRVSQRLDGAPSKKKGDHDIHGIHRGKYMYYPWASTTKLGWVAHSLAQSVSRQTAYIGISSNLVAAVMPSNNTIVANNQLLPVRRCMAGMAGMAQTIRYPSPVHTAGLLGVFHLLRLHVYCEPVHTRYTPQKGR